jgi:hypothetical protein
MFRPSDTLILELSDLVTFRKYKLVPKKWTAPSGGSKAPPRTSSWSPGAARAVDVAALLYSPLAAKFFRRDKTILGQSVTITKHLGVRQSQCLKGEGRTNDQCTIGDML